MMNIMNQAYVATRSIVHLSPDGPAGKIIPHFFSILAKEAIYLFGNVGNGN